MHFKNAIYFRIPNELTQVEELGEQYSGHHFTLLGPE